MVLLITVFGITAIIFAWSNPTVAPPGGNLSGFLNTGSTAQTKTGALTIQNTFSTTATTTLATSGGNFTVGATPAFVITSAGQVGIGTTGPSELLHLMSSTAAKPILRIENTNADNNPGLIHFIKDSTSPATDDLLGQLSFYGDDSGGTSTRFATIFARSADVTDTTEDGSIHFKHFVAGTDTEIMTLISGNVGIGTTGPETPLHIVTTNKLGSTFTGTTGGEGLRVAQSNYTNGNYISLIEAPYDDGQTVPVARIGARFTGSGSYLSFGTSNSYASGITNEALTIKYDGNVGIGTTGPTVQFERVCQAGFTNVKAGNNQLGCIETAEHGTGTWYTAANTCFTTYGGRLPIYSEWYVAMNNYALTGETGNWEWLGSGDYWTQRGVGIAGIDAITAVSTDAPTNAAYAYRCLIPR